MAAAQAGGHGGQPLPPQIVAAKMKAAVVQAQTNMQIAQTVGNSSLAKLTDDQTRTFSDGKFFTTKEFVNFMQSANTEVGKFKDLFIFSMLASCQDCFFSPNSGVLNNKQIPNLKKYKGTVYYFLSSSRDHV